MPYTHSRLGERGGTCSRFLRSQTHLSTYLPPTDLPTHPPTTDLEAERVLGGGQHPSHQGTAGLGHAGPANQQQTHRQGRGRERGKRVSRRSEWYTHTAACSSIHIHIYIYTYTADPYGRPGGKCVYVVCLLVLLLPDDAVLQLAQAEDLAAHLMQHMHRSRRPLSSVSSAR